MTAFTRTLSSAAGVLAAVAALAIASAPAHASTDCLGNAQAGFGVAQGCFDGQISTDDGSAFTQAAGHPYSIATQVDFNTETDPLYGPLWPAEPTKSILVDVPAGVVGSPVGIEQCNLSELAFTQEEAEGPICSAESQVGTIFLRLKYPFGEFTFLPGPYALYSMVPPPGVPARFGANIAGVPIALDAELRNDVDGGYSLTIGSRNSSEGLALLGVQVTIWGDPASPAHEVERQCPGVVPGTGGCPTTSVAKPLLRTPSTCTPTGHGLATGLRTDSWEHPGAFATASFESHIPPGRLQELPFGEWGVPQGPTGCDQVPFEPQISIRPTTQAADSPTGLDVDLTLPQGCWEVGEVAAVCQSDLKKAIVTLPEGMSVNPSSAGGLGSCDPAQIELGSTRRPSCPSNSKIGEVAVDTPLLDHQVKGSVYLASQEDNPFNSLLAIYIVTEDVQSGVVLKLAGHVEPRRGGQLVTTFDSQPQFPFTALHLELFGGPRAALRTPPICGTHAAKAELTPWSGTAPVDVRSSFAITSGPGGSGCPNGAFDPKLSAAATNPIAGSFSPFTLRVSRNDGTAELGGISATLPPGLLGRLTGIPYCPDASLNAIPSGDGSVGLGHAQLSNPSCPAASQVGIVTVGAGAGPIPFFTQNGKAYLAGPYKGAPLSLAVVTPAVAGPFDLGNVVVRNALQVDSETARITVVSDPLPSVLAGIPLDLRDVRVEVNRPDFTLNPTSCDPMVVEALLASISGTSAERDERFQVAGCNRLAFKPRLGLRLSGATGRTGHPALRAVLRMPKAGANIARASVSLPHSEFLDQSHIQTICTRVQFAANACPAKSVYGYARATSPLLDQPLAGPVYLRSSANELPDLVAALDGQIDVDLVGRIDTDRRGGIRTTFATVPDAPVFKVILRMKGGKKGLIENSEDLCTSPRRATVKFDGQNGKIADSRRLLKVKCAESRKGKRR